MKRGTFILLLVLISMLLLYSPIKTIAQSPSCPLENTEGYVSGPSIKIEKTFSYENRNTSGIKINSQGQVFAPHVTSDGQITELPVPSTKSELSTENCVIIST